MHGGQDPLRQQGREYDIREIPEDLYLAVLACRRAESGCSTGDLAT